MSLEDALDRQGLLEEVRGLKKQLHAVNDARMELRNAIMTIRYELVIAQEALDEAWNTVESVTGGP